MTEQDKDKVATTDLTGAEIVELDERACLKSDRPMRIPRPVMARLIAEVRRRRAEEDISDVKVERVRRPKITRGTKP